MFSVRYGMYANPPGRTEQIGVAFRDLVQGAGMESYFGALGGGVNTYGVIWREDRPLTIHDRDMIEQWLRKQPMDSTVRLGELEELDETDIMRDFDDCEFTVTNLTDADRKLASDREREMAQKVEAFMQRRRPT